MTEQLEFFEELAIERAMKRSNEVKESLDKMRRKHFAELSELRKRNDALEHRLTTLEQALCRCHGDWSNYPLFAKENYYAKS
jgi:hypothetical protein